MLLEVLPGTRHTVVNTSPGGHGRYCTRLNVEASPVLHTHLASMS